MVELWSLVPLRIPSVSSCFSSYVTLFLEENVFGSAWRLVWSRAVESLFDAPRLALVSIRSVKDCQITDVEANNMDAGSTLRRFKTF